jgi:hypothetical protein
MRKMKRILFGLLLAALPLALVLALQSAAAAGRPSCLVSNDRTGFGARSLQAAIDAAAPADTLIIKGTCVGPSTLDKRLTLQGVSNKAFGTATLDGDHRGPVLASGGATIRNLTITNGLGFGIEYAMGLTLIDSVVTGNDGIGIWGSDMTIDHSVVTNNAGHGIALFEVTFTAHIDHSTISGNGGGGGVGVTDGVVELTDSTATDNSARSRAPASRP